MFKLECLAPVFPYANNMLLLTAQFRISLIFYLFNLIPFEANYKQVCNSDLAFDSNYSS